MEEDSMQVSDYISCLIGLAVFIGLCALFNFNPFTDVIDFFRRRNFQRECRKSLKTLDELIAEREKRFSEVLKR